MLGAGVTIFPDNLAAGTAGEVAFAKRQGLIEGRELRRLGVDVSFGPVLDVLTERYSPNIGIRSYGKDPALVVALRRRAHRGACRRPGSPPAPSTFPGRATRRSTPTSACPSSTPTGRDMHAVHLRRSWRRWRPAWTAS